MSHAEQLYPTLVVEANAPEDWLDAYREVRLASEQLCSPLETEDYVIQSMDDVSPPKWHLAHVTWFFETFLHSQAIAERVCLGIHHEQQHQELLAMDIKHILTQNPLQPVYSKRLQVAPGSPPVPQGWRAYEGGLVTIGLKQDGGKFAFDNERPAHRQYLEPFELATRPVTNQDYMHFMERGGYQNPALWLSDGWHLIRENGWMAPLYWAREGEQWYHFTLTGWRKVDPHAPVCHVSFYEADAFARWAGARLPTEAEWEQAATHTRYRTGNFAESGYLQPVAAAASHIRPTYPNFYPPSARWAFSGIRLAREAT